MESAKFDPLLKIMKNCLDKAEGEIYCFEHKTQKKSATMARGQLQEIIRAAKELRKLLISAKKDLPTRKRQKKTE